MSKEDKVAQKRDTVSGSLLRIGKFIDENREYSTEELNVRYEKIDTL